MYHTHTCTSIIHRSSME